MPIRVDYRRRKGEQEITLNVFDDEATARAEGNKLWKRGCYEITILDTTPRVIARKTRE